MRRTYPSRRSTRGVYRPPSRLAFRRAILPRRTFFVTDPTPALHARGVVRASTTGGARLVLSSVVLAEIVAALYRLDDLTTPTATLADAFSREWQDWLSEPGQGSLSLMNDDTDLASIVGDGNDLVLFTYKGQAAFMLICEAFDRVAIAQEEEQLQATVWSGRGHLALLERGVVYPTNGVGRTPIEEDRYWNWASDDYDDTGWGFAKSMMIVSVAKVSWIVPIDVDFPDDNAHMIWASTATSADAPEGDSYFRSTPLSPFTVAADAQVHIYFLADNQGELYVDGQLVLASDDSTADSTAGFTKTADAILALSAGDHTVAIHGVNFIGGGANNPAGVAAAIYSMNPDTQADLAVLWHTDQNMKIVEYPPEAPGMTVGQVMILALQEWQARLAAGDPMLALTWSFDLNVDTAGEPWAIVAADVATKVGTDILTFFRELAGTYVDMRLRPGQLVLDAWNLGTKGQTRAITLVQTTSPATSNLTMLVQRGEV